MRTATACAAAAALLLGDAAAAQPGPPERLDLSKMDPGFLAPIMIGKFDYDTTPPVLPADLKRPAVLVFTKTNGFRDGPSIDASIVALRKIAKAKGWSLYATENGAVFNPAQLKHFDAIVFSSTSGSILTPGQQEAFKAYLEAGGGFVGIHGAGGDPFYFWHWYVTNVIGAQFVGHPMGPQFQQARLRIEDQDHPATRGLGASWTRTEEWYSFQFSPRPHAHVLISLDESTYRPVGIFGDDLRMGDHPVVWTRCLGAGRVFYSALGHKPETYAEPKHVQMLTGALSWSMGLEGSECVGGVEKAPRR